VCPLAANGRVNPEALAGAWRAAESTNLRQLPPASKAPRGLLIVVVGRRKRKPARLVGRRRGGVPSGATADYSRGERGPVSHHGRSSSPAVRSPRASRTASQRLTIRRWLAGDGSLRYAFSASASRRSASRSTIKSYGLSTPTGAPRFSTRARPTCSGELELPESVTLKDSGSCVIPAAARSPTRGDLNLAAASQTGSSTPEPDLLLEARQAPGRARARARLAAGPPQAAARAANPESSPAAALLPAADSPARSPARASR